MAGPRDSQGRRIFSDEQERRIRELVREELARGRDADRLSPEGVLELMRPQRP
jgi:hypothetical protein